MTCLVRTGSSWGLGSEQTTPAMEHTIRQQEQLKKRTTRVVWPSSEHEDSSTTTPTAPTPTSTPMAESTSLKPGGLLATLINGYEERGGIDLGSVSSFL